MPERDPIADPRPGDLWYKDGVYRRVEGIEGRKVLYRNNMSSADTTLAKWIEWCRDAEIMQLAERVKK